MDFAFVRNSDGSSLAKYLRDVASRSSTKDVTGSLLGGIESGCLPPWVFKIWLTASNNPEVVNDGLRQEFSRTIRKASIERFRRWLRTSSAETAWQAVGGTAGILDFLFGASVSDVKQFCHAICNSTSTHAREQRQERIDELFKALNPQLFPGEESKVADERPLSTCYLSLLGGCSPQLAFGVWSDNLHKLRSYTSTLALSAMPSTFRLQCLDIIAKLDDSERRKSHLGAVLALDVDEPLARTGERMSPDMAFAIEVLRKVSEGGNVHRLDHSIIHSRTIIPLFQKLRRWKSGKEATAEAIRLFLDYRWALVEKDKNLAPIPDDEQVLRTVVHRWGHYPEELQESLERLLNLQPFSHSPNESRVMELVRLVPLRLRYGLLRLLLLKTNSRKDIELDGDLKALGFQWSPELLLALPRRKARQLLERLIRLQPAGMHGYWRRWNHKPLDVPRQHEGDPTCLLLLLSRGDGDCRQMAESAISDTKNRAQKARKQEDRANLIQQTLHYAIASGSLDLYRDTLLWTRKYIKDPVTCMQIYSGFTLLIKEGLDLLSGLLLVQEAPHSVAIEIRHDVGLANQICEEVVETACLAQNEPSFQAHHWRCALNLMWNVVQTRMAKIGSFKISHNLSDSDLFELVWQPTIGTIMKLESIALDERNAQLFPRSQSGRFTSPIQVKGEPSSFRFCEELSKLMDEMWVQHRQKQYPATTELPAPFPKGLALQDLTRCRFDNDLDCYDLPLLRSRAGKIVFAKPEVLLRPLSDFEEVKGAVDRFIDDWSTALSIYVYTHPKAERYERACEAWNHAIGPLSRPRMSEIEAFEFWRSYFIDIDAALPSKAAKSKAPWNQRGPQLHQDPRLPALDSEQPVEWHPDPEGDHPGTKSRTLEPTCLDAQLFSQAYTMAEKLNMTQTVGGLSKETSIWRRYTDTRMSRQTQEALIAAAALYIGEKNKCPGIFSKPFPSYENCRFPALYLDEEFLDRPSLKNSQRSLFDLLKHLNKQIPPKLLLELTEKVFVAGADRDGLQLLQALARSDRPQLALDLVKEVIIERPQDSSWHRNLLNDGFLGSLPKATVKAFLASLSDSLHAKMIQQSKQSKAEKDSSRQPIVKVTTVKMLAQILCGAEFVDAESVANILIGIFENSRHLDIRVAVVESMLEVLTTTANAKVKDAILNALETHGVPIMSSLNERRPLTTDEWQSFEDTGFAEMPEVYMETSIYIPPILTAVCDLATDDYTDEEIRKALAIKVLYPTLSRSIEENRRWFAGFFQHLGMPPVKLPPCPVKPFFLSQLMGNRGYCKKEVVETWYDVFAMNYDPPTEITALNQRIKEDHKLRSSNAGQHWLNTWDQSQTQLQNHYGPAFVLREKPNTKAQFPEVGIADVEDIVLKQTDLLLRNTESQWQHWNYFINTLGPYPHSKSKNCWTENSRPVLETIVKKIEDIRASDGWKENPDRTPSILPSTFTQRLWLAMHGPAYEMEDGQPSLEKIADRLDSMLCELAASKQLYLKRFPEIVAYAKDCGLHHNERVVLANLLGSKIGDGKGELGTEEYLRVEFAREMLLSSTNSQPDLMVKQKAIEMVRRWAVSLDEEIRMSGLAMLRATPGRDGKKPWYTGET